MFTMFQDRHLIRHEHNYTHEQDKVEYKDENTTEQGNASEPDPEAYLLMRERKILENKLKLAEMFKTSILDKSFDSESSISSSNASSTASLSLPSSPTQSTKVPSLRRSLTRSNPSEDPIFYSARHVDEQQERHVIAYKQHLESQSNTINKSSFRSKVVKTKNSKHKSISKANGSYVPLRYIVSHVEVPRRSARRLRTLGSYELSDDDSDYQPVAEERRKKNYINRKIRSRLTRPERFKRGSLIYDSINGTSCHQCRQKTTSPKACCTKCPFMFDLRCLTSRYGDTKEDVNANANTWLCPSCRGICNCSRCRRDKGLIPTGQLAHLAQKRGFSSVAEYLGDV